MDKEVVSGRNIEIKMYEPGFMRQQKKETMMDANDFNNYKACEMF